MHVLISLILSGIAVLISAYIIPGVIVDGFFAAIVVVVIHALVNIFIRPIVSLLTLPINILTLGLFGLIINGLMVMLTATIVPGFEVSGFLAALLFGIALSLVNGLLFTIVPNK